MKVTTILCGTAIGFCFVAQAGADPLGYGIATDRNLYSIDLGSATATPIGLTNTASIPEGLAQSPTGILYATDSSGNLYDISTLDGSTTLIGDTGRGNIEGLDFNGNVLIGAEFTIDPPTLFSINLTNASTTDIVTATSAPTGGVVRSMATLDANTMLLANNSGSGHLNSIDLTSGVVTPIGFLTNALQSPLGLDFASNGTLYGAWSTGEIHTINPNDGSTTLVGNTGSQFWLALTAVVPEPTTFALAALGLLGIGLIRRKRM